ncbi:LLM class flavin-dependent oxidoreductase [Paraburkholderia sp. Ac-20336]|uniref:LLM class flavin-dependent oxidoreductase n=1 Tax=Paraburkholderia sp. Ac-20336 TaxID=2703886 RepID=UPI00197E065B|nr:LLM class flavin-dependent oxidoreductase [Paraburkholderia sp. Ac-20336]MBN3801544.1 LLM class flavin-dependent oxidoreductase [Paraburkholderia sp. Ac-20336]
MSASQVEFGFMIAASDVEPTPDLELYRHMIDDARFGYEAGFRTVWTPEHHFSSYFPTPSPLMLMSNIASRCPGLGLGTMVLVTPWHNPVRLAGEIAMLSLMSDAPLHLGLGRGAAPLEYDAFDLKLENAKARFQEVWEVLDLALSGKPFTYEGQHVRVPLEVRLRPDARRENINFYGAIGSPDSATKIAELGLPPISNGTLPLAVQRKVLSTWHDVTLQRGGDVDVTKPVAISCIIADSDDEAEALARKYMPRWFELQVEHYRPDEGGFPSIPDYQSFAAVHERRVSMCNPDNLGPFNHLQLFGSPATVCERVQEYLDVGFNHLIVMAATPGIPQQRRREWLGRFASEVAPHFSAEFAQRARLAEV